MSTNNKLFHLGNRLFEHCYPLYLPLYSAWKAVSDRHERRLLQSFLAPGMVMADVGANIGIYSRFFSRLVGPSGQVHAFEPAPDNFAHLRETTRDLANIVINQAAVGERSGTVTLFISDTLNVDHQTYDSGEGRRGVDVPLVALDEYFPAGCKLDFIKIDVQGFEMSVFKGASRVLADNADIGILTEFWPYGLRNAGSDPREVIAFIRGLGFNILTLSAEGRPIEDLLAGPAGIEDYWNVILTRRMTFLPAI
jgi:FkbM family methyltransferase